MKVLIADMDGCLTDGSVYVDEKGRETRKYFTTDSMMFDYWEKIYFITREKNKCHYHRFKKLYKHHKKNIQFIRTYSKSLTYLGIVGSYSDKDEIDFIGDDLSDVYIIEGRDCSYVPLNSVIDLSFSKNEKIKLGIEVVNHPVIPSIIRKKYSKYSQ
jgi:3-deoxy-D-manno-octulosonate 8-phosphate phosphatase (KDO 8-P phosphatase)